MGRVAGEEQAAALHRLGHERAHRGDALLEDGARVDIAEPDAQLIPDPVVGPVLDVLVDGDLKVQPTDLLRAHRVQREPVLVPGVDQLVGGGLRLGEDPEPAELIDELVLGHVLGDRLAAHAVEAVASRDRVAHELVLGAPVGERDPRRVGLDVVELHVGDLEPHIPAAVEQRRDQVLDDLLLPVDRDVPAGQRGHVDVVVASVVAQVHAGVLEPLAVQALGDAEVAQQVHGVLLEQPGADSLLDVLPVARLQHDAVDALALQQQGKREPRRTGADDSYLGSHGRESIRAPPRGSHRASGGRGRP